MPDYLRDQLPDLLPEVMDNVLPTMLPEVASDTCRFESNHLQASLVAGHGGARLTYGDPNAVTLVLDH